VSKIFTSLNEDFPQRLGIFNYNFTRLVYYVRIYAKLQSFIHLSVPLTGIHINRDHRVNFYISPENAKNCDIFAPLVATLKVRLAKRQRQHRISASESPGTQGRQSSTVCSRGDRQVHGIGGCTE